MQQVGEINNDLSFLDVIGCTEIVVTSKREPDVDHNHATDPSIHATVPPPDDPSAPEKGISSSLLEVITELRKRTKSEGDRFLSQGAQRDSGGSDIEGKVGAAKKRRRGTVVTASSPASTSLLPMTSRSVANPRLVVVDGSSFLRCDSCAFISSDLESFEDHRCETKLNGVNEILENFLSRSLLPCLACSRCFEDERQLESHKAMDDNVKCRFTTTHACSFCEFVSRRKDVALEHAARAHKRTEDDGENKVCAEDRFRCDICGFTSNSIRSLKSHMKRHVNDLIFQRQNNEFYACNLCAHSYIHLPSLKSHMWRHASSDSYDFSLTNDILSAAIDFDCRSTRASSEARLQSLVARIRTEGLACHVVFGCSWRSASSGKPCQFRTIDRKALEDHSQTHFKTNGVVATAPFVISPPDPRLVSPSGACPTEVPAPTLSPVVVASSTVSHVNLLPAISLKDSSTLLLIASSPISNVLEALVTTPMTPPQLKGVILDAHLLPTTTRSI